MPGFETGIAGGFALILLLLVGLVFILYLVPLPLWIAAWASGAYVGLFTLIGMRLRRVPPGTVVTARISAVKAGLDIPLNDLEAHYLAGGNVVRVVNAMISADKANIALPFKRAAAIDLAGIPDVMLVTLATDGGDGPTDAAGAVVTGETFARASEIGLNPLEYLARNDSYHFFDPLGDLIRCGPTRTNVNDLAFIFAF